MKLSDLKGNFTVEPTENISEVSSPKLKLSDLKEYQVEDSDRYVSSLTPTKSGDLLAQLEASIEKEKSKLPEISPARSALVGAGQGATFGLAEELSAPFVAAAGMLPSSDIPTLQDESQLAKFQRLMQEYRNVAREEQQSAQEQNPGSYMAGQLVGGAAAPGLGAVKAAKLVKDAGLLAKIGVGSATGAGMGGLAGAGEAEGSLMERLPEALEGAQTGAFVGGAIPAAGATFSKLGEGAKGIGKFIIGKPTQEAYEQGAKGYNVIKEGAKDIEYGRLYEKSKSLVDDVNNLFTETGKKIENSLEQKEGSLLNLKNELDNTFDSLNKLKRTEEGIKYANDIESELKTILKNTDLDKISPQQAQDIKQVMYRYSPSANLNITPQQYDIGKAAGDLSRVSKNKLSELSPELAQANKEYQALTNVYERLKINEKQLPEQQTASIAKLLSNLEKGNLTAFETQKVIDDVVNNIKSVNPKIADQYGKDLNEISKRLNLMNQLQGGSNFTKAGVFKRGAITSGNIAGLGAKKVSDLTEKTLNLPGIKQTSSFAKEMLTKENLQKSAAISPQARQSVESPVAGSMKMVGVDPIKGQEYYKHNRRVAQAAESADPELLKSQAQQIRKDNGTSGEQLAIILEKMAEEEKDARRALMFSVLQNPVYRKMLGLTEE